MDKELTVIEIRDQMRSNQNLQLIDVRTKEEFEQIFLPPKHVVS